MLIGRPLSGFTPGRLRAVPDEQSGRRVAKMIKYTIDGLMTEHMVEGSYNPEVLYEEIMEYLATCETLLGKRV